MNKVRTHSFNSVRYRIGVDDPYDGWCDPPRKPQKNEFPAIRLPNGLPCGDEPGAKIGLINLLHEIGHARNYKRTEKVIDQEAIETGTLLWRLGYRRRK